MEVERMETAFIPFEQYMDFIAEGKLDGYINSNDRKDKVTVPEMMMSTDVNLLLNQLGEHVDKTRMESLFDSGTTYVIWHPDIIALVELILHSHLFNTSGSGKTRRRSLPLLGILFSCRHKDDPKTGGSLDVDVAISDILPTLSTWDGNNQCRLADNATSAERVLRMLLCVRVFILGQLVRRTPRGTKPFVIRRRWVLLQTLPPVLSLPSGDDIFVSLLRSLRAGDTQVMKDYTFDKIVEMNRNREELFPNKDLFAILDDAQDAARRHIPSFPATTDPSVALSALHELYRVFKGSQIFTGIILSGTGLSMDVVKASVDSMSAKPPEPRNSVRVFTDTGHFLDKESQKEYVLPLSDANPSDRRLLERIQTWFIGRYVYHMDLIFTLLRI
jgi:hypothetical protein